MKVSCFIRSYAKDFPWLRYCLRSLILRGQQFHEVVVAVPQKDFEALLKATEDLLPYFKPVAVVEHAANLPYVDQQITKMHADRHCEGDFIMHLDSDCVVGEELHLPDFFSEGLPKLLFRRWEDAGNAICWRKITKGILLQEPPFETMAAHPFLYHRSTHELFRNHLTRLHAAPEFIAYARLLREVSEFNAIGNFCLLHTPDAYRFIRAAGPGDGWPRPIRQFWSHDVLDPEKMEALLR